MLHTMSGHQNSMMPKTLVVSWMLPPSASASAAVMGNLLSQFSADEVCVVGQRVHQPGSQSDQPLGLNVEELDWERFSGVARLRPLEELMLFLRTRRPLERINRIIKREKVQAILAVYPRGEYLWLAYLAARQNRLPLFPYFHNTYLENMRGAQRWIASRVQARVLAYASHTFAISQGLEDHYRSSYPGLSVSSLLHSFREPLPEFTPLPPVKNLRLAFCGLPSQSCIDALSRMIEAAKMLPGVEFTFFTPSPRTSLQRFFPMPSSWVVHDSMTVPREQLLEQLRNSDVLMLPHGFDGDFAPVEYQTIFPSKTIEYLISGRPILAHSPPGCFLTGYLKQHGCAMVVDDKSVAAIIQALETLRRDAGLRAQLGSLALKTATMFKASHVADQLRQTLRERIPH